MSTAPGDPTSAESAPLWHGRFESGPSDVLWAFTVSLPYDHGCIP